MCENMVDIQSPTDEIRRGKKKKERTRMWADAQRDGRPAEYRWRRVWTFRYSIPCTPPQRLADAHWSSAVQYLFHDLLLRSYLYHCVWSVITAHNLTPEKRNSNCSPHPLIPTSWLRNNIQLITGILPCFGCL